MHSIQHDLRWLPLLQSMESDSRAQALLPPLLAQLSPEQREAMWMERLQRKQGQSALIDSLNNMDDSMGRWTCYRKAFRNGWLTRSTWPRVASRPRATGIAGRPTRQCWPVPGAWMPACCPLCRPVAHAGAEDDLPAASEAEPKEPVQGPNAEANAETIARLKAEQAARRARARLRPWDDERVLEQLNRIVDLRLALHAATRIRILLKLFNPSHRKHTMSQVLRQHAEQQFAEELDALQKVDDRPRPPNWKLSPWAVLQYLMGGRLSNGFEVSAKYIGNPRLMEIAVSTLATDRALLLYGVPGTAKSWVSEHLSAAVSGDSTMLIQGTAGTSEEQLRYGWNYAQLLAHGPSERR